jgi:putative FmdB family regulatory protein
MPIYEFYCSDCHCLYNFLARTIDTRKRPACPGCGRAALERRPSAFAISRGRAEGDEGGDELPDLDEARMEQAMAGLAQEAEGVDEDDPRAIGRLMQRFYAQTGMPMSDGMREAIRRMEGGDDPERIEAELGDLLDDEDPFSGPPAERLTRLRRRLLPPRVDPRLHEL